MAGHSHWANIQHKKGIVDARRGKAWSKASRAIITAARNGGGDPAANLKLRYAIDKAREVNMPKDTIERAVKRGTGDLEGHAFEEITYEGYGPGGVAILVDILTDNRNCTAGEIRKLFERGGGKMATPGSVAFQFERKGVFAVGAAAADEDRLMGIALDAGAEDVQRAGDSFEITCDPGAFSEVKAALERHHITPTVAEIDQVAGTPVDLDTETGQKVLRLMEALDDHDDVQKVYANLNITDAMVAG